MTLGYVVSRYPLLSETFILREMWELERQGHNVRIYPLRPVAGLRHARATALRAPVWRAGWCNPRSQAYWLQRRPKAYLTTLAEALWQNRGDANLWLGAMAYWPKAAAIARRMQRDQVDQIHAHYATHPALAAYIAHRLTGIPFSFTAHAHDIFLHRAMLQRKIAAASQVIAISRFNQAWLERARGGAATPIPVVHCGVESDALAEVGARRRPPKPGQGLRLLSVGSLQAYKGHRVLVEACARLRAAGLTFHCRIVGGGRLAEALRRQIASLGLEQAVVLAGPAAESAVAAALADADVFVLPSIVAPSGQMEGIPVALMEAMAAGLPVVASRLSGIPELVTDGHDGLLTPPGDAVALAQALERLADPELRRRLGAAAQRRVRADFDLEANVAHLARAWQARAATGTAREAVA
jgi:colanic acid/amylovoran biosynthesis glycosyltransferase